MSQKPSEERIWVRRDWAWVSKFSENSTDKDQRNDYCTCKMRLLETLTIVIDCQSDFGVDKRLKELMKCSLWAAVHAQSLYM